MGYPKVNGVGRMADNDMFERKLTDDELREFHEFIRENSTDGVDNFLANLQSSGIRKGH